MKIHVSAWKKFLLDQSGQVMPWLAMTLVSMLGVTGMGIDVGHAYVSHSQLQNYANAAALAAAGQVYNTSSTGDAATYATTYSASSGNKNSTLAGMTVTTTVSTVCLNSLLTSGTCSSTSTPNAVRVRQTATVPTWFMRMFGFKNITVSALSVATMQGKAQPWNVAIIMDSTGSMNTTDSNCSGVTEYKCAMNGVAQLLGSVQPCSSGSCTASNSNFRVALFSFPNVSTTNISNYYTCSGTGTAPTYKIYTLPVAGLSSYTPLTYTQTTTSYSHSGVPTTTTSTFAASYEVTYGASDADANGFVADYFLSSASNRLNSSSSLVKAISGCMTPISTGNTTDGGLQGVSSGGITYYASALYAAQAALAAEQQIYPDSKNAIIFLSDGQANMLSSSNDFPNAWTASNTARGLSALSTTGYYPSAKNECQQAILAAQYAATQGTTVFGVAYGSQQSGCSSGSGATDTSLIATGQNQSFTASSITPCITIENIASSIDNFYSDYLQSGSGVDNSCVDSSHYVTSLSGIFSSIAAHFTQPRLVSSSAT